MAVILFLREGTLPKNRAWYSHTLPQTAGGCLVISKLPKSLIVTSAREF